MSQTENDKIGLNDIMQRAQEMQKKLQDIQKQVAELVIEGTAGGGAVKVKVTGQHYVKEIYIEDDLFKKEDKAIIEDLLVAAFNDATAKIETRLREQMSGLAGLN